MSGTPNTAQTLTPEGQRLADALPPEAEFADILREAVSNHNDVDGVFWVGVAREVAQAIGNAALLFTAPEGEGAGLREAVERCAEELDEIGNSADPFDDAVGTQDHALLVSLEKRIGSAAERLRAALASPQPAVEGPVAAGLKRGEWNALVTPLVERCKVASAFGQEAVWNSRGADALGQVLQHMADVLDSLIAEDTTLTPPADPKPTVPGNDAGMREAPIRHGKCVQITEGEAAHRRSQGLHVEWAEGVGRHYFPAFDLPALAPQNGSAGEDPKTPDAGVGDGDLREADAEKWSVASGFPHTAESSAAWMDSAAMFSRNADFYHGIVVQIGEMFGDAAKTSDDGSLQDSVLALKVPGLVAAALAQPAPVGEYETGGREARSAERFLKDPAVRAQIRANADTMRAIKVVTQPPKAETPAGVGEDGSMPPAAYFFAVDKWGSTWVTNEFASLREFAALSAAPAARTGDGVVYPHLPLRIIETEDRHGVRCPILIADAADNDIAEFFHSEQASVGQTYEQALALARRLVSPAAPAADGGQA